MPNYDYDCRSCGTLEVFQSMKEDHLKSCPKCDSQDFKRIVSGGSGVHYRAKGFYSTDYRKMDDSFKKYLPRED